MAPIPSLSSLLVASLASLVPFISASPLGVTSSSGATSSGYWDITYTSGSPASGAKWDKVSATYSGAPQVVVTCSSLYDPATRKTKQTCSDKTFSYSVGIILGRNGKTVFPCSFLSRRRVGAGADRLRVVSLQRSSCSRLCNPPALPLRFSSPARIRLRLRVPPGPMGRPVPGLRRCQPSWRSMTAPSGSFGGVVLVSCHCSLSKNGLPGS